MSAERLQPDAGMVRRFVEIIHAAATSALKDARDPGVLQISVLHPQGKTMVSTRFPVGAVDEMADYAINAASNGFNTYVEPRTVDSLAKKRGTADDTRAVFGFVDDLDADRGKAGKAQLQASLEVETSPGNRHRWLFLDRALTAEQAQPLSRGLRAAFGSDSASAKPTQPYRVAGTPNFPDAGKIARGRTACPTSIITHTGVTWSAEDLADACPPVGDSTGEAPSGRSGIADASVEELVAERGVDRSGQFFRAIIRAIQVGMLPGDVEDAVRRHPGGCGGKYLHPRDRLAEEIARAWPKAQERLKRPAVDPTYPDNAVPVEEAREAVCRAIQEHLDIAVGYRAIRVSTGVGKTRIAAAMIAADVLRRRGMGDKRTFLYAVPRHKLGDEVAALFQAAGVTARVFRGREADDPSASDPGTKMCLDIPLVTLARTVGATVSTSCCKGKHPLTGTPHICPSYTACAYQAQLRDKPDVWITPHQLLFHAQAAVGEVAGVFVDEGFWQAGIRKPGKGMTLDEFGSPPNLHASTKLDGVADVAAWRSQLAQALRNQLTPGGVRRRHVVAESIDADVCTLAKAAEWKLKTLVAIWPGMGQEARRAAAQAAKASARAGAYATFWDTARDLVAEDDVTAVSGRLFLDDTKTDEGTVRVVRTRGISRIAKAWADAPTFCMDATLPDVSILRRFYPEMDVVADIEAQMPHARVRQVLGAPTSANKLLRADGQRNLGAIRRALLMRFLEVQRGATLVIAQQKVAEWLKSSSMPAGIEIAHFNAISGLDRFKDIRLLVVIGRTMPSVLEVEAMAGTITGLEGTKPAEPEKGPRWYEKTVRGLRMADGTGYPVDADHHPDPMAEAVRSQICEGEIIQAIGRARGVNRTAANPVDIEIWNDLALPVTIDAVLPWAQVPAGYEADMLVDGIVLESPSDMTVCWPKVWGTEKAAEHWRAKRASPLNPIDRTLYRGLGGCSGCGFSYKRRGVGRKWRRGWYYPRVVPDPKAWLEARLGALAGFGIEAE